MEVYYILILIIIYVIWTYPVIEALDDAVLSPYDQTTKQVGEIQALNDYINNTGLSATSLELIQEQSSDTTQMIAQYEMIITPIPNAY